VTVLGGTGFSTLSGSSMGATALLGSLLVPEMNKRGYKKRMSIGPILGTGGLAIIIPPSALAVLLATLSKVDIGALLVAGIVPGLVLAGLYIGTIWIHTRIDPAAAPSYDVAAAGRKGQARAGRPRHLPDDRRHGGIVAMMLGGIATPSEAAAFGALGVLVLAAVFRCLTWEAVSEIRRGCPQGHADGLSDRVRLGHLQPAHGLFRRLARPHRLGDQVRPRTGPDAAGDVRRAAGARHVHGADLDDAAHGADLLPAGVEPRLRSDVVCAHHAAGARDQLHHAAARAAAVRDEGCGAARHDDARNLRLRRSPTSSARCYWSRC
jgi:hypothetical protein